MHSDNRVPFTKNHRSIEKDQLSAMGKSFIAILLIVVFEGAIRKWISSSFTNAIVLLRDTIAFCAILWAIKTNHLNFRQLAPRILWLWSFIIIFWALLQLIINNTSLLIFIMGIRFWLLYLWFGYAAGVSLTKYDFNFVYHTIILLLCCMVPLAIIQHYQSPSAFINKQVGDTVGGVFIVSKDIVRTTGTFSFTLGYTVFLAIVSPFVFTLLTPGISSIYNKWISMLLFLVLGAGTIVSGSRAAIIFFGLLYSIYALTSLKYSKSGKKGITLLMIALITALLLLTPLIFSRALNATQERFKSAALSENITDRIFSMFFGEPYTYENLPVIGHGLGLGTNFASAITIGKRSFLLAETETARIILEGGLMGFTFIGLKLLVVIIGLYKSLQIMKSSGNPLSLLLWITTCIALLSWSIIGQLTVNAFGYLLLGLAIATLHLHKTNTTRKTA